VAGEISTGASWSGRGAVLGTTAGGSATAARVLLHRRAQQIAAPAGARQHRRPPPTHTHAHTHRLMCCIVCVCCVCASVDVCLSPHAPPLAIRWPGRPGLPPGGRPEEGDQRGVRRADRWGAWLWLC
jgi:hypothetical protein